MQVAQASSLSRAFRTGFKLPPKPIVQPEQAGSLSYYTAKASIQELALV